MSEQNIILHHTEQFTFEKLKDEVKGKETIIISGNAQPLNEDSRNGVRYRPESVKKNYKTLEGAAFLNGHDPMKPLGHVAEAGLNGTHMTYKVDVDPEEKEYIRKVERGDIRHVSVGCMVENVEWDEKENIYVCDVKEYVELSAVTVPGFSNTSANKEQAIYLANALGNTEALEKLKAESINKESDNSDDEKDKEKDETDDSDSDKPEDKDKDEEICDKDKDQEADDKDSDKDSDSNETDDEGDKSDDETDKSEADDTGDDSDKDKDDTDDKEESTKPFREMNHEELIALCEKIGVKFKEDATDSQICEEIETQIEEADEDTIEEQLAKANAKIDELYSKFDEVYNRLSIVESNVDAMNEEEDTLPDKTESKDILPDVTEKFKDNKPAPNMSKENLDAKEKALTGSNSKKINEQKNVVDMNDVRMNNISY